jgi:hypothetical protein
MDAFAAAFGDGLAAIVLVWPLAVLARTTLVRRLVLVLATAGFAMGAAFQLALGATPLPIEAALLKAGTAWAGICLLLAVLEVSGLDQLRARFKPLDDALVLLLAATALPLSGSVLVRSVSSAAFLKESWTPWVWAALGLVSAVVFGVIAILGLRRLGVERVFRLWSYLLVAPVIRVAVQPTILGNLEAILSRVAHDTAHVVVMLLQLPDHAYLSNLVWNVIGLAFMRTTGLLLNLAVYLGAALYVAVRVVRRPLPLNPAENPAERRRRWSGIKAQRRLGLVPIALGVVLFGWLGYNTWIAAGTAVTPTPVPLAASGIETATLADGALHSFTFGAQHDMRVLAIRKPDSSYSVCLDACLVCPPDGYAQLGQDLFCTYCGTPIPIGTVGQPGGCNPVPLAFRESGGRLVFDQAAAEKRWAEVNKGK